jgi:hypothetical protein
LCRLRAALVVLSRACPGPAQIEILDLGNGAAAKAALTDDVLNLGSLTSAPFNSSSTLNLQITLATNTVGSEFDVGLLIGDPPCRFGRSAREPRLCRSGVRKRRGGKRATIIGRVDA